MVLRFEIDTFLKSDECIVNLGKMTSSDFAGRGNLYYEIEVAFERTICVYIQSSIPEGLLDNLVKFAQPPDVGTFDWLLVCF